MLVWLLAFPLETRSADLPAGRRSSGFSGERFTSCWRGFLSLRISFRINTRRPHRRSFRRSRSCRDSCALSSSGLDRCSASARPRLRRHRPSSFRWSRGRGHLADAAHGKLAIALPVAGLGLLHAQSPVASPRWRGWDSITRWRATRATPRSPRSSISPSLGLDSASTRRRNRELSPQAHRAFCRRRFPRGHSHALGDHIQKGARPLGDLQTRVGTFAARDAVERGDSAKSRDRLVNTRPGPKDSRHDSHAGRKRCAPATSREPETGRRDQRAPEHQTPHRRDTWTEQRSRPPGTCHSKDGRACPIRIVRPTAWSLASRHPMAGGSRFVFSKRAGTGPTWPGILEARPDPRGILRQGRCGQPPARRDYDESLGDRPSERTRVSAGRRGQAPGSALIMPRSLNARPTAPVAPPP